MAIKKVKSWESLDDNILVNFTPELIVFLEGTAEIETYETVDPIIIALGGGYDSLYRFQGYQVFYSGWC